MEQPYRSKAARLSPQEAEELVQTYGGMLFRLCLVLLRQRQEAEDAVQETFLRYLTQAPQFHSPEHEKAWLIRVATNLAKNSLRFRLRRPPLLPDQPPLGRTDTGNLEVIQQLLQLPLPYREAIYLYYIEGYASAEIARLLKISDAAVRKRLQRGRKMLKLEYEQGDAYASAGTKTSN